MKKIFLLPSCAVAICLAQACSSTSETTAADSVTTVSNTTTTATNTIPDTLFAVRAAEGGMAEVELGNIALSHTNNTAIKDFANMMITDHTKANNELMALARTKNITLPTTLDAEHQAKRDSLTKLTGAAFDKAYMATMVTDHQKTLSLMQAQASGGIDANLKDFAAKTTPVIQMHLEHAQRLQANTK